MEYIEGLVRAAKEENWDYVDSVIPEICNRKESLEWAYNTGIRDEDDNVRDLAVSILEKASIDSSGFDRMRDKIAELMESDPNPYVRYRSAFTLAAHGPGKYRDNVLKVLKEAEQDRDVSEISKNYQSRLE